MDETGSSADGAGVLWLVVGPSGAGKDTLIDGARAALAGDPRFVFPRRDITRPADAGGEDHRAVDLAAFEAHRAAGGYVLSWGAHGLHYGVPVSVADDVAAGRAVVVNVSRGVIGEARRRFVHVRVISVTVPPEVLAARLAARGRESAAEIEARLQRAVSVDPGGEGVIPFVNDRPRAAAIEAFVAVLRG
jgi:ribose 1,5-bisphosphokinase